MIKKFLLLAGLSLPIVTGLGLSSCSDDDDVLTEEQIRQIVADEVSKQTTGNKCDDTSTNTNGSLPSEDNNNNGTNEQPNTGSYTKVDIDKLDDYLYNNQEEETYIEVIGLTNENQELLHDILKYYEEKKIYLNIHHNYELTKFYGETFEGVVSLVNLIIPNTVTSLAIQFCDVFPKLDIPKSVTEIEINNCKNLKVFDVPEFVEHISISHCDNLEEVIFHGDCPHDSFHLSYDDYGWNPGILKSLKVIKVPQKYIQSYKNQMSHWSNIIVGY